MGRIICISNQKGGVGKTTTAINLAASLAAAERKTLLIDLDPQGNAGSGLGLNKAELHGDIYEALINDRPMAELLHATELKYLEVVPATPDLTGAELELIDLPMREARLKHALKPLASKYDYVLIDCPPSLGLLTLNALTAADAVLVPLQCEYYAMEGLAQLMSTIERVRKTFNPRLHCEGILLTMYDSRANIAHQVAEEVKKVFPDLVFKAIVPRNVRLAESPSFGKPILLYDIKSKGCEAYLQVARELMRRDARGSKGTVAATRHVA
ncbi:MAG: ParA family protein [Myxococcaceae bacterium]|nr:ParA family protein [Myxococcaceae bacterium]